MPINEIKLALENMDKGFCMLSTIDYAQISEEVREICMEEKYLERPFAYEFYHQLRKLMERGEIDFGGRIIQAEVDKTYQHCFEVGKIPDFIIHTPNLTTRNLAVIEFKISSNLYNIPNDFNKLVEFKTNPSLCYSNVFEVIIGDQGSLERARRYSGGFASAEGEEIVIIEFDVDSWKANEYRISYRPITAVTVD
ncbi:MAG: hypothetical protein ACFFCW_30185 [Candidatus Hodarchaeota archaeon]